MVWGTELVRTMTGGYSWFIVLAAFMGVSWLAEKWARSEASPQMQYAGLALFVVAEAIIFLPLLYIAAYFSSPNVIPTAGIVTALLFGGLTYIAFTTRRDFLSWAASCRSAGLWPRRHRREHAVRLEPRGGLRWTHGGVRWRRYPLQHVKHHASSIVPISTWRQLWRCSLPSPSCSGTCCQLSCHSPMMTKDHSVTRLARRSPGGPDLSSCSLTTWTCPCSPSSLHHRASAG